MNKLEKIIKNFNFKKNNYNNLLISKLNIILNNKFKLIIFY